MVNLIICILRLYLQVCALVVRGIVWIGSAIGAAVVGLVSGAEDRRRAKHPPHDGVVKVSISPAPEPRPQKVKPQIDPYAAYDAADGYLDYAAALDAKAATEKDDLKRARYRAQARAQRLKAEQTAAKAPNYS